MMPRLAILTAVVLAAILAASASASAQPGTPDPTFGSGGTVTKSFGDTSRANGISVAPGAELVAGGITGRSGAFSLIARLTPGGALDPTWAAGDVLMATFGDSPNGAQTAQAVVDRPDGQVVAAGVAASQWYVVRYRGPASDPRRV